jgi:MFS family permease
MGVSWNLTNVGALADAFAAHYGVSLASVALLTSALFFSEAATAVPAGRVADRIGAWRLGMACLVITIVGNAGLLMADGFEVALALRVFTGIGVGCGFLAGAAYVHSVGGSALAQGVYGSLSMAAGGLALAILPMLEEPIGWQASYLTSIVAALLALAVFAPAPAAPKAAVPPAAPGTLLRDRRILRFAAVQGAAFGLTMVLSASIVPLLERRGGLPSETAGVVGGLILLTGIAARPVGGALMKRRPPWTRAIVVSGMACGALGTVLLGIASPAVVAIAGGTLVGVASGIPFPATMAGLAAEFPRSLGSAFGAMNFYVIMTVIVGTPLLGLTFSLEGDGLVGVCAVAVLWVCAAFAVPRVAAGQVAPA